MVVHADAVRQLDTEEGNNRERVNALAQSDPDPGVRMAAAERLGDDVTFEAVSGLLTMLQDPEPEVLVATIEALDFAGDESLIPYIEPLARHPDERVSEAASELLEQWGSEPGGKGANNTRKMVVILDAVDAPGATCDAGEFSAPTPVNLKIEDDRGNILIDSAKIVVCEQGVTTNLRRTVFFQGPLTCENGAVPHQSRISASVRSRPPGRHPAPRTTSRASASSASSSDRGLRGQGAERGVGRA